MSFVSSSVWCFMVMISTMCKSIGSSFFAMHNTASTTMVVNLSANSSRSLVLNAVRATHNNISRSTPSSPGVALINVSKNFNDSRFATSIPSTNTLGCKPSFKYLSACFKSSPMTSTVVVVPSPVMSSCATAVLAIITAVGF